MDKRDKRPYPVPVQASQATAGTAIPVGWKIVVIDSNPFFVQDTDKRY